MTDIYAYGDSILKATVPDKDMRYHFHFQDFFERFAKLPVNITNRARFGATVDKGQAILQADLNKGISCQYALLEFGGNDCNFDWATVAASPEAQHDPNTSLQHFCETFCDMAASLRSRGIQPVTMTLPPIDAEKYLDFITRGEVSRPALLRWLGDANMIYRFQELYSDTVYKLALRNDIFCLDIRSAFLSQHSFCNMISADGIHLNDDGYDFMFNEFARTIRERLSVA